MAEGDSLNQQCLNMSDDSQRMLFTKRPVGKMQTRKSTVGGIVRSQGVYVPLKKTTLFRYNLYIIAFAPFKYASGWFAVNLWRCAPSVKYNFRTFLSP